MKIVLKSTVQAEGGGRKLREETSDRVCVILLL